MVKNMVWYIKTQKKTQKIKNIKNREKIIFFFSIFSMDNKKCIQDKHVYYTCLFINTIEGIDPHYQCRDLKKNIIKCLNKISS